MVIIWGDHVHCFRQGYCTRPADCWNIPRQKQLTWTPHSDHSLTCSCYNIYFCCPIYLIMYTSTCLIALSIYIPWTITGDMLSVTLWPIHLFCHPSVPATILGRVTITVCRKWYALCGMYWHTIWSHDHVTWPSGIHFWPSGMAFWKTHSRWVEFIHNIVTTWRSVFSFLNFNIFVKVEIVIKPWHQKKTKMFEWFSLMWCDPKSWITRQAFGFLLICSDRYNHPHSEKSPARPMLFYSTNYWQPFWVQFVV